MVDIIKCQDILQVVKKADGFSVAGILIGFNSQCIGVLRQLCD